MLDDLFTRLFKYAPTLFRQGDFELAAPPALVIVVLLAAAATLPLLWRYRRVEGRTTPLRRAVLGVLRCAVLAVVVFCLLQPTLVLSTLLPQQSFVGVLADDSLSMKVTDQSGGEARGAVVSAALSEAPDSLTSALEERFKVRLFGFADQVRRLEGPTDLEFSGGETALGPALQRVSDELASVPLAGLVLLSDGADTVASTGLSDVLLELRARGVPVSTVGVGQERFDRDIEVSRVVAPRTVLAGSSLQVEVSLEQVGFSGSRVTLEVVDSGRLLSSQEVRFPTSGETVTERVTFTATEAGPRRFTFRVVPQPGEVVTANNERQMLLEVVDRREKILYFEGEPRFELKFIRRAVSDDENLQVVCLQRTAENKFLRLDIDEPTELEGGFPTTREELFRYRGIILGSIEASYFTYDQLRMLVDFVGQRGGGLLMLGGRHSFSEGGYGGTPVDDLLPVVLGPSAGGEGEPFFSQLKVKLTPLGRTHPATQLLASEEESARRWETLPPVSTFNPVTRLKPGAVALLVGEGPDLDGEQVVLAHQRYGRGRSLAFTVHDSWLWQMHADIPLEDMTHETLWRQLLRWLVSYVPDPVTVSTEHDRNAPGNEVRLVSEVRDASFLEVNDARVVARVEAPDGTTSELPMEWSVQEDGRFEASFVPHQEGLFEVSVEAWDGGNSLGSAAGHFEVAPLTEEFFSAERRTDVLQRIAEETGGRYYSTDDMKRIADDLRFTEGGATVRERFDLWDMPILFLALLLLLSGEWMLRKFWGLA